MTKLADLKQRLLENPDVQKEYARADAGFSLIEAMIRVRREAKLTQAELAEKIGTTIAQLEAGRVSPSIATLRRYAEPQDTSSRSGSSTHPRKIRLIQAMGESLAHKNSKRPIFVI